MVTKAKEKKKPNMVCPYCGYEWVSKVEKPLGCPRCKLRFDYRVGVEQKKAKLAAGQKKCDS